MKRTIRRHIEKRLARVRTLLGLQGGTVTMEPGGIIVRNGGVTKTALGPCPGGELLPTARPNP